MQCSTGDLHEEISDLAAPRERDAFEDGERTHEAVFAEIGAPCVGNTLGTQGPLRASLGQARL
jgi:hypothetical protein